MSQLLFEKSGEELYARFHRVFGNIKKCPAGFSFKVLKVEQGDIQQIFYFYEQYAPLLYTYQPDFENGQIAKSLLSENEWIIAAYRGDEVVGYLMLVTLDDQRSRKKLYQLTLICVKEEFRKKDLSVYLFLCGFLFAKEIRNLHSVFILVDYGPPRSYSLKGEVIKWEMKEKSGALKFSGPAQHMYARTKFLYHVFEEILNLRLAEFSGHTFFIIDLKNI